MFHHIFLGIDTVFWTNDAMNCLLKESISVKEILQGDTTWSTSKVVLGWKLDTKQHHPSITPNIEEKVRTALAAIPKAAR